MKAKNENVDVICFTARDNFNNLISEVSILKRFFDTKRPDIIAKAIQRLIQDVQSKGIGISKVEYAERIIDVLV